MLQLWKAKEHDMHDGNNASSLSTHPVFDNGKSFQCKKDPGNV